MAYLSQKAQNLSSSPPKTNILESSSRVIDNTIQRETNRNKKPI